MIRGAPYGHGRPVPRLSATALLGTVAMAVAFTWATPRPALADRTDRDDANRDGSALDGSALLDREHRFTLTVSKGWTKTVTPEGSTTPLLGYQRSDADALLAVARVDYPNLAAWRSHSRADYYREVVRGVEGDVTDYKRIKERDSMQGIVPALDLVFQHRAERGDEVVFMRFLFFRRYTLSLSISVPARKYKRERRAIERVVKSFKPYLRDS